jgi:hypothetical protein
MEGLRKPSTFSGPLDHNRLVKATLRVWNVVFESSSELAVCLTPVLEKDLGSLETAFDEMREMALGAKAGRLDEICRQFLQKLGERFQDEIANFVPDEIHSFVRQAKVSLNKINGIFSD